ncbi:MAG: serine/threonine-protein phosphatase [Armatimonadetes bacterium]|nr:serine/threonine-protein phosphatase [Armatimonadota bacterium]
MQQRRTRSGSSIQIATGKIVLIAHRWHGARRLRRSTIFEKSVKLEKGDLLILYTDGLSEARNKDGEIFGIRRLREVVGEGADLPVKALANKIYNGVQRFTRRQFLEDDFTLLVIRVQ